MTKPPEPESWAVGTIGKHGADAIRVCCDILEAGLRTGRMSAADMRDIRFAEPNVVGAVFHACARKCGFRKAVPGQDDKPWFVKMGPKRKHARPVPVWVLDEPAKARLYLKALTSALVAVEPSKPIQMLLGT
jgi:hypothetical protein